MAKDETIAIQKATVAAQQAQIEGLLVENKLLHGS